VVKPGVSHTIGPKLIEKGILGHVSSICCLLPLRGSASRSRRWSSISTVLITIATSPEKAQESIVILPRLPYGVVNSELGLYGMAARPEGSLALSLILPRTYVIILGEGYGRLRPEIVGVAAGPDLPPTPEGAKPLRQAWSLPPNTPMSYVDLACSFFLEHSRYRAPGMRAEYSPRSPTLPSIHAQTLPRPKGLGERAEYSRRLDCRPLTLSWPLYCTIKCVDASPVRFHRTPRPPLVLSLPLCLSSRYPAQSSSMAMAMK
jgi:hypothetical protein